MFCGLEATTRDLDFCSARVAIGTRPRDVPPLHRVNFQRRCDVPVMMCSAELAFGDPHAYRSRRSSLTNRRRTGPAPARSTTVKFQARCAPVRYVYVARPTAGVLPDLVTTMIGTVVPARPGGASTAIASGAPGGNPFAFANDEVACAPK